MSIIQSKNLQNNINKRALIISDSFPYPPRNGMEVTCYQNALEFLNRGTKIKFLILYSSNHLKDIEQNRYKNSIFSSEIEFIEIVEKSIFKKIINELFLVTPTYLNYSPVEVSHDYKKYLIDIDFIFIPPVKGVHFYTKYLHKHAFKKNIRTVLHTNDCISSYYYGTFMRMFRGFEKKTILGFSYILRYPFIRYLERKYLRAFNFCLVQTKNEKIKIERLFHNKIEDEELKVIVKTNKPSAELIDLDYFHINKDILLMSHFIDNRAYSAIWFINNVWKNIVKEHPDARLFIYGAINSSADMRKNIKNNKNIFFNGFAESLSSAYKDKLMSVVPIFQNNGQITRVSDSLSAGLPCFTTPEALSTIDGAIEGIHAISAKNAKDMTAKILNYITNHKGLRNLSNNGKILMKYQISREDTMNEIYE